MDEFGYSGWGVGIPLAFNTAFVHRATYINYLSFIVLVCFLDVIIAYFLLFVVVSSLSRKKGKNF